MRLIQLYLEAIVARVKRYFRKKPLTWLTSDLHFGHRNVIIYCKRPFHSVEQMDRFLVFQWNCFIAPQDTVYCLGDFALNRQRLSVTGSKLNGKRFLVSGNHDKTFLKKESQNKNAHGDIKKAVDAGWTVTQQIELGAVKDGKDLRIVMTHLPPTYGDGPEAYDARYMNERIARDPDALHLHGHLHGRYVKRDNMIDCGWDVKQRPLTFKEVMETYEDSRQFIPSRLGDHYANRKIEEEAG